jgi:four helix bundle protein
MDRNPNEYDLEERTFKFAKSVTLFVKKLDYSISNNEYSKQVVRSAGSVSANYIEANESLGKKDFLMHVKICRKEAKETANWIRLLIETNDQKILDEGTKIYNESVELKKIFSAIVNKSE